MSPPYRIKTARSADGIDLIEVQRRDREAEGSVGGGRECWAVAHSFALPGLIPPPEEPIPGLCLLVHLFPWFYVEEVADPAAAAEGILGTGRGGAQLALHPGPLAPERLFARLESAIRAASGAAPPEPDDPSTCPLFAAHLPCPAAIDRDWATDGPGFIEDLDGLGWRYGDTAELAEQCGWGRPACLSRERRGQFLTWLRRHDIAATKWRSARTALLGATVARAVCRSGLLTGIPKQAGQPAARLLVIQTFQPEVSPRERESLSLLLPRPALASHVGPLTLLVLLPGVRDVGDSLGDLASAPHHLLRRWWSDLHPCLVARARKDAIRFALHSPIKAVQTSFNRALHPVTGGGVGDLAVRLGAYPGGPVLTLGTSAQEACAALGLAPDKGAQIASDALRDVAESWARPWHPGAFSAHFAAVLRLRLYNALNRVPRKVSLRLFGDLVQHAFTWQYEHALTAAAVQATEALAAGLHAAVGAFLDTLFAPRPPWRGIPSGEREELLADVGRRLLHRWKAGRAPASPEEAADDALQALLRALHFAAWWEMLARALPAEVVAGRADAARDDMARAWKTAWPAPTQVPPMDAQLPLDYLAAVRAALHWELGHDCPKCRRQTWRRRHSGPARDLITTMAGTLARALRAWIGDEMAYQTTVPLVDSWLGDDVLDDACCRGGHAHRIPGGVMDAHRLRFWPSSVDLYLSRLARGDTFGQAAQTCRLAGEAAFKEAANIWCVDDVVPPAVLADPGRPLRSYTGVLHSGQAGPLRERLLENAARDESLARLLDWATPTGASGRISLIGSNSRDSRAWLCEVVSGCVLPHDVAACPAHEATGAVTVVAVQRRGRDLVEGAKRGDDPFWLVLSGSLDLVEGDLLHVRPPSVAERVASLLGDDPSIASLSEGERLELGRVLLRTREIVPPDRVVPMQFNGVNRPLPPAAQNAAPADGGRVAADLILSQLRQRVVAGLPPENEP